MDTPIRTVLKAPAVFPFPFEPYTIQTEFMNNLYNTIENGKLGIFESPTGTGKSMSIICGALKWLIDSEERNIEDLNNNIAKISERLKAAEIDSQKDWFSSHEIVSKLKNFKYENLQSLNKISNFEKRILELKILARAENKSNWDKSKKYENLKKKITENNQEDFEESMLLSDEPLRDNSDSESEEEKETNEYYCQQVIICSRTHSQLSQLVGEIRKSPFKDLSIRIVPLASRHHLCINEDVLSLKQLSLINEACQDLRSRKSAYTTKKSKEGEKMKKVKSTGGCPYTVDGAMKQINAKILTDILDLEDLNKVGHKFTACPYFGSRNAVKDAQVILLPYNVLLHKNTREASGIRIKNSVVIIDEAHNLLDAIAQIHSAVVSGLQLTQAHSVLIQYREKYSDKFSPANLLNLNQLIFVVKNLLDRLTKPNEGSDTAAAATLAEFLVASQIDNINLHKLLQFASRNKLSQKIRGFVDKFQPQVRKSETKNATGVSAFLRAMHNKTVNVIPEKPQEDEPLVTGNPLIPVIGFIEALTNHCEDSRVFCLFNKLLGSAYLKFLLLNPAAHFEEIIEEARSVIVAGGTMQPISEFTDQLFKVSQREIQTFSCGHVIPQENILPIIVKAGPTGREFLFNYSQRDAQPLIDELVQLLINISRIIPAGIVVFYPSYDYEDKVYKRLVETGKDKLLEVKKKLMREPRGSGFVDKVLEEYAATASTGAILFAVVGGKLSEGLNFNDDLGRCIVLVGMPYPNKNSPELAEKMSFLDKYVKMGTGQMYYENLCIKAVNQSIGRSVRHAKDYAAVLLLDSRYSKSNIQTALPNWMKSSLKIAQDFRTIPKQLVTFFCSKK